MTTTYNAMEWTVLCVVLVPVTAIVSITTNAILIAAIRTRGNWDTTDTIFFALTISDCLHGVVSLIGALTRMLIFFDRAIGEVLFPIMMTTFYYFLFNVPTLISKTLTAMLSVERTIAVFNPTKFKTIWSKRRVIVMVCCAVFLIATSAIPKLFQVRGAVDHNDTTSSAFIVKLTDLASGNRNTLFIYNLVCQNLFGTVPIILVFVLNCATIVGLRRHNKKISPDTSNTHSKDKSKSAGRQTSSTDNSKNTLTKSVISIPSAPPTDSGIISNISNEPPHQIDRHPVTSDHRVSVTDQQITKTQQVNVAEARTGATCSVPTVSLSLTNDVSTDPILSKDSSGNDKESSSNRRQRHTPSTSGMSIAQRKITVTLITIATVFVIFNLPAKIFGPIYLQNNASTKGVFQSYDFNTGIGKYMELLNSIINSIIYVMRSQKYRSVVRSMFRCCR